MKILSLSTVYPNPEEPGLGLFVRSRLQALTGLASVQVIAPVPIMDYSNPKGKWIGTRHYSANRQDDAIEVNHPRWFYPPGGTFLNAPFLYSRLLPMVSRICQRWLPDLIDAHFGYPEGVAAALLSRTLNVPFTITLRGSEPGFSQEPGRRAAIRWAMREAYHVIAVSDNLRNFAIQQGVSPHRVSTIPNGVDQSIFYPRCQSGMRTKYCFPADTKVIVSAGELIEAKGHHLVIRSVRELLDRSHNVILVVAGSRARGGRPYDDHLRQLIADLSLSERVRFAGFIDRTELPELLSAADVFCLASYTEGWPNVVNEALACGTPVVASSVGGVSAMISNSSFGIVVPPKDQLSLTNALATALDRQWDREAISLHGRQRSWREVAREVFDIFDDVLSRSPCQSRLAGSARTS